jgi:hypothetical protein
MKLQRFYLIDIERKLQRLLWSDHTYKIRMINNQASNKLNISSYLTPLQNKQFLQALTIIMKLKILGPWKRMKVNKNLITSQFSS